MEYVYLIGLVIAIIVWIVKGIIRFFKWVATSFSGATSPLPAASATTPPPTATTPAPMPPRAGLPSGPASPMPPQRLESVGPSPTRIPSPVPFQTQEAQRQSSELAPLSSLAESPAPAPATPTDTPLFSSTDDLVRAFILSEVLGSPLSRRRTPSK